MSSVSQSSKKYKELKPNYDIEFCSFFYAASLALIKLSSLSDFGIFIRFNFQSIVSVFLLETCYCTNFSNLVLLAFINMVER